MNSFEGQPIIITEVRYQDLVQKENKLKLILAEHPELEKSLNLTSAAKKYKNALIGFMQRVEQVIGSKEFFDIFQMAAVHGFQYKGESLAQDIENVKKITGLK